MLPLLRVYCLWTPYLPLHPPPYGAPIRLSQGLAACSLPMPRGLVSGSDEPRAPSGAGARISKVPPTRLQAEAQTRRFSALVLSCCLLLLSFLDPFRRRQVYV